MPLEVVARARGDNLRGHVPGITFLVGNQEGGGQSQAPTGREFIAQGSSCNEGSSWCAQNQAGRAWSPLHLAHAAHSCGCVTLPH
jgi:hypothetical protein